MVAKKIAKTVKSTGKQRAPMTKRQLHLLEGAMLGGFAFVIGSIFLISSLQNFLLATNQFASVVSSVLVDLANGDRVANSLGNLTVNDKLVAAAQAKADDMAAKGYFSHNSPDGTDSWYWFQEAGYQFKNAGENLAVDFSDSTDVERAWMNSPSHRENILNGAYTEVGIATAAGYYQGRPTTFVVQMFGTPAKTPAVAQAPMSAQPANSPTQIAQVTRTTEPAVLGADTPAKPAAKVAVKPTAKAAVDKTAAIPAQTSDQKPIGAIVRQSSDWQILATSPSTSMRYSYYLLALLVLLALVVDTGLELHWHHRKRAATAGALLAIMAGLFFYSDATMFKHATVAQGDAQIHQTL